METVAWFCNLQRKHTFFAALEYKCVPFEAKAKFLKWLKVTAWGATVVRGKNQLFFAAKTWIQSPEMMLPTWPHQTQMVVSDIFVPLKTFSMIFWLNVKFYFSIQFSIYLLLQDFWNNFFHLLWLNEDLRFQPILMLQLGLQVVCMIL